VRILRPLISGLSSALMPKSVMGAWLDVELAEKLRDAAYWDRESISDIVAEALRKLLAEREMTRGSPYPPRPFRKKRGRPSKSSE